jgi:DNA (cytosine-5)-methyltransferase 1
MKTLDLFSGIGGFALGLESVGFETAAFCERDLFCQAVLRKHWPGVPIHSDITELDGYEYRGTVELVCGGFPCQPFSVAGKRKGAEDDRALWPEMLRVIREVQPTWVIGENVTGIIAMELDTVLFDLEREGYACQTFVIPACAIDAPHRRDRIWVVAYSDSNSQPTITKHEQRLVADAKCGFRRKRLVGQNGNKGVKRGKKSKRRNNTERFRRNGKAMADTNSAHFKRRRVSVRIQPEHAKPDIFGDTSRSKAATIWKSEPSVGRVADGVPNRSHRLRSLGNAVVPQVVAEIGKAII